eukprot:COSAG02_NODE_16030_length_1119_cov_3.218627_1_plen_20_part_01
MVRRAPVLFASPRLCMAFLL